MDGTISRINEIGKLCLKYDSYLIIDEAHSSGLQETTNCIPSIEDLNFNPKEHVIRIITYGKAFGCHGAVILASKVISEYLINYSRPFIYSTAPSPLQIEGIKSAYNSIQQAKEERKFLFELIKYWNKNKPSELDWIDSQSPIQSVVIPGNKEVIACSDFLRTHNLSVLPIRNPTVHTGFERIRCCIHSYNTKEEIDFLFSKLLQWKNDQ